MSSAAGSGHLIYSIAHAQPSKAVQPTQRLTLQNRDAVKEFFSTADRFAHCVELTILGEAALSEVECAKLVLLLPKVVHLSVFQCDLGAKSEMRAGLRALWTGWRLQSLELSGMESLDSDMLRILVNEGEPQIKVLRLNYCPNLEAGQLRALFAKLQPRVIDLTGSQWTPFDLVWPTKDLLVTLRSVILSATQVRDIDISQLHALPLLQQIDVTRCPRVTSLSLQFFACMHGLTCVDLRGSSAAKSAADFKFPAHLKVLSGDEEGASVPPVTDRNEVAILSDAIRSHQRKLLEQQIRFRRQAKSKGLSERATSRPEKKS